MNLSPPLAGSRTRKDCTLQPVSRVSVVEVSGLSYRYDDGFLRLDGIDFQLAEAETVALLGPNGAGKTTFVLHLNGLLRGPGKISICGLPLSDQTLPQIRRQVGMVFQDADEQLFMPTVLEDVASGLLYNGYSPAEALPVAREALRRAGMAGTEDRSPHHLSAGEKRRVAIAGVLAMNPSVLILDEPTTFLDPPGQRDLVSLLQSLPQAKVLVTHDVAFARSLTRRAVFMQNGKIAADGDLEEIVRRFNWET